MQCTKCGKTERVIIGNKQYCSTCGMLQPENSVHSAGVATAQVSPTAGKVFSDLRPPVYAAVHTEPAGNLSTAIPAVPTPPTNPIISTPQVPTTPSAPQMIQPKPPTKSQPYALPRDNASTQDIKAISKPNPAGSFHAAPTPPKPATLDLRSMATGPVPTAQTITTRPVEQKPTVIQPPITRTVSSEQARAQVALITPLGRTQGRIANAGLVTQSTTISKFGHQVNAAIAPTNYAHTASATPVATPTNPPTTTRPPEATANTSPIPSPGALILPNSVVSQIESLSKASAGAAAAQDHLAANVTTSPAVKPSFKPASVAAAVAAIAIMGGYTWINNYPKMSVKTAASKAGIEASLPSYVPGNYSLGNQVSYAPGEVTLTLHNNQSDDDVSIKQRRTSWDSSSLLENFVAKDTSQYSSVQGQGLTIYLYDTNKASWVNHGIWYSIEASNSLTRDQLLKIAYSL